MKRITTLSVVFLFLAGIATAATNSGTSEPLPIIMDTGGPDAFGYSWIDNDSAGGPDYQWIDITSIGTQVTGLTDDNNIGPISMGFNFPYYWYEVNHMWIGSNGYISFSSSANYAHPFSSIPYFVLPNDLLAILTGDLDFTQGNGECWYYTNSVDTFIVSYLHVTEFGDPTASHTFQCILTAADSTIKFQYGPNQGDFGSSGPETVIGMENVNGQVGLEYLEDNSPAQHMWHDGLAIAFHPEPDPNFVVHDFGMVDGLVDGSAGQFIPLNEAVTVRAKAKNFGNQPEDSLRVRCQIRKGYNSPIYDEIFWIAHLDPGEEQWITYPLQFTPTQDTVYRVTFSAILSGDQNTQNNSLSCEIDGYQLPQQIAFCDDLAEASRAWNGDFSGFAQEFQMPEAVHMTNAYFNINGFTAPGPAYIWVLPDDGTGHPDEANPLAGDTITITSEGWKTVDFSADDINIAAYDKFWIVEIHAYQTTFGFGMDQSLPLSYRGWEYTGGLAPDRDRTLSDVMIKFDAQEAQTGIDDENIAPTEFSLSQNYPNPFNAKTNIAFTIENESDVSIGIYNITGQKVADMSGHFDAGENIVSWDGSDAASGVYFYRLSVDDNSQTMKMVLLK